MVDIIDYKIEGDRTDWIETIKGKLKKKNQILFSKDCDYLQDLMALIGKQNHKTMVLWAFEFAEETVNKLEEKYPNENRPRKALETTKLWASGKVKMPTAKQEILKCHAFAKEIISQEDIALCHSVGQACGVVHANGHAIGFPIYDLTAIVYKYGIENCKEHIENRKKEYIKRIVYWEEHYQNYSMDWANFMLK
jgi:hypothetical protein